MSLNKIIWLLFTLSFYQPLIGQQIISPYGGQQISGEVVLNSTLGELAIAMKIFNDTILTEGFHQPFLILTNTVELSETKIHLFPNPTNNLLHIILDKNEQVKNIEIYDMSGRRLIQKKEQESNITINLANLPPGFFILKITTAKSRLIYKAKFIKL